MNITQVKIFPVEEEKLKAFVSIVFDHCFMVNDIKVIQGKDGLFLSMPSRRKKSGEFKDVAHPLNNDTRRHIEQTVLREYRSLVDDPTPRRPDRDEEEGDSSAAPPSMGESSMGESPMGESERVPSPVITGTNGSGPGPVRPSAAAGLAKASGASDDTERDGSPAPSTAAPNRESASESAPDAESSESAEESEAIDEGDPSLEEVQERHLRDSFWSVG